MKNSKEKELAACMKSLSKKEYQRDELIGELLKFQDEIVEITFNKESNDENLRIFDVEDYLAQKNKDLGNPADQEFTAFQKSAIDYENYLKKQISGIKGENRVFATLNRLNKNDIVLTNLEMTDEKNRTELDAVVITSKGITIVEVKNTKRDIFIDSEGKYYRTGEFLRFDSNLGEKMKFREELIKNILLKFGFSGIPVKSLLVFTNPTIQVQNKCNWIHTAFLTNLVSVIDDTTGKSVLGDASIECIGRAIEMNRTKKSYPLEIDADQMKIDFAKLIIKLQSAEEAKQDTVWKRIMRGFRRIIVPEFTAGYMNQSVESARF